MSERVLVIDDEAIVRALIVEMLEDAGYETVEADRAEARARAARAETRSRSSSRDIVMPGLSGLELLETVRASHPSLPVVLVTGAGTYANLTQALADGRRAGIVVKPFSHAELVAAVALGARPGPRDASATSASGSSTPTRRRARSRTRSRPASRAMHGHCERLAAARAVASPSASACSDEELETVRLGAILHDVGKIGIPDRDPAQAGRARPSRRRRSCGATRSIGDRLLEPLDAARRRARRRPPPPRALGRRAATRRARRRGDPASPRASSRSPTRSRRCPPTARTARALRPRRRSSRELPERPGDAVGSRAVVDVALDLSESGRAALRARRRLPDRRRCPTEDRPDAALRPPRRGRRRPRRARRRR